MNRRTTLRATPRLSLLACALAATLPALAQNVGTGTRFTPVLGAADPLHPATVSSRDLPPQVTPVRSGAVDYAFVWKFGVLAAVAVVCYVAGAIRFQKKDLPL